MSDPTNPGTPPSITAIGPFPARTAAPDDFEADMDAAYDTLEDFPAEQNALATWQESALTYAEFIKTSVEATQTAVNASTGANVTAAQAAQTAAEAARDIAEGFANYQGDYDAGTFYAIGESVTYSGLVYVKKSAAAAGTTPVDGADWRLASGSSVDFQEFTTSGTWTKPAGVSVVYVEIVGAGGGGDYNIGTSDVNAGHGGPKVARLLNADDLGATVTVTIGAGGTGRTRVAGAYTATALQGGSSSFGTISTPFPTSHHEPRIPAIGGVGTVNNPKGTADNFSGAGAGGAIDYPSAKAPGASFSGEGAGGAAIVFASTGATGNDGVSPGGGGGAIHSSALVNDIKAGDGADGRVRVWAW